MLPIPVNEPVTRWNDGESEEPLRDHREALTSGSVDPYRYEIDHKIDRLCNTLISHLRKAGFRRMSVKRLGPALSRIIVLLFDAQDERPMFHIEGTELPLCWNSPQDWDKAYIKYQWGHLLSRNQNPVNAHSLENLALYSARCNNQIQTSLDIQELMLYGGILANRISAVLTARRKLFASTRWQQAIATLQHD